MPRGDTMQRQSRAAAAPEPLEAYTARLLAKRWDSRSEAYDDIVRTEHARSQARLKDKGGEYSGSMQLGLKCSAPT